MIIEEKNRRDFLKFMRNGTIGASMATAFPGYLSAMDSPTWQKGISPTLKDNVILAKGLKYQPVISWEDPINEKETFGFNNDYTAFFPIGAKEAILWVNHEYPDPLFVCGKSDPSSKTKTDVIKEQESVGGSFIKIKQDNLGNWLPVKNDKSNRRISARTKIPFSAGIKVMGQDHAVGTLANCSGGVTPWGTVLTCEENYSDFYGEAKYNKTGSRKVDDQNIYGWRKFFNLPPEHYGWVVEANPKTGKVEKHTALGRFAHEGAAVVQLKDGRVVVYMGDDANDQCFYKFISSKKNSLDTGTLYVASLSKKRWLPLDRTKNKILKEYFKSDLDMLIQTRKAAALVGGTPMDRPEGSAIDPLNPGHIYLSLTNNKGRGNYFGYVAKFIEKNQDHTSEEFEYSTYIAGGKNGVLACPDNLAFDPKGNLWIATDISGSSIGKGNYSSFGNNSLFYIPLSGKNAGKPIRVASAPNEAEFTGPTFTPDGKTLFISVQHPGERTKSLENPTSKWAVKGDGIPRPTVIAISGF
ncbi:MAG: DUF839 domain-containing protein [Bdellovibrionota bacterium]